MKTFISIIFAVVISLSVNAQSGVLMNRYYYTGSLSLGQKDRVFADSSAWLHIGKDTTNKGLLMPRVLLDSISTTKRALFVYDLEDSVLYHFDGSARVRYMTYRDTAFIRQALYASLTADAVPEGDTNKYYSDARARSSLSAGAGISYDTTTGAITNTGVTTVNGLTGAVNLDGTYHKQGGSVYAAPAVVGTTNAQPLHFITNNATHLSVSSTGKTAVSAATNEEAIVIGNDQTNKVSLGVGRGSLFSINTPYLLFGNDAFTYPSITAISLGSNKMDFNNVDALQITPTSVGTTPEIRGRMSEATPGSVIGIGSRANGVGLGHTGSIGTLNWLTIPWHVGVNSDIIPSSGNMDFNIINIVPRINQTGAANGSTRGIFINPQIMNAVDFRGVELANNTGHGIYQSGSDVKNYFNGKIGIKTTNPTEALEVNGNIKTAQPSSNGAGVWKFGKIVTGVSVTLQTDKFIEVEIDGIIRKLAIVE